MTSKRERLGWAIYDWASSPVPTIHATFVFAVYFTTTIMPENGTFVWAWLTGGTAFLVALAAPFAGRLADTTGRIKSFLVASLLIGASATGLLWFAGPEAKFAIYALVISAISIFFMEISFVFYNAMLGKLSHGDDIGKVSGWAWGTGYLGAVISLVLVLAIFILPENKPFGLNPDEAEHVRATMIFVMLWAVIFSIPMMLYAPSLPATPQQGSYFNQLKQSVRVAMAIPDMVRFLLARMAFNDGLVTLFAMGGIYAAKVFGFAQMEIILFAIALNVSAGFGAIIGGWADDRIGPLRTMRISLICLMLFGLLAIIAPTKLIFWIAGICLGIFVGPLQSAARSYVARQAPDDSKASLFGLYMVSGKITSIIGPFCYGLLVAITGIERAGMVIVLVLIGLGFVLLPRQSKPDATA